MSAHTARDRTPAEVTLSQRGAPGAREDRRPAARMVGTVQAVLTDAAAAGEGVLWRLGEAGRQLDANVLRLPGGASIATHTEADLDVLLVVLAGSGTLTDPTGQLFALTPGAMVWLPRGASRALSAGEEGMAYLTAHQRRPGLAIGRRIETTGIAEPVRHAETSLITRSAAGE